MICSLLQWVHGDEFVWQDLAASVGIGAGVGFVSCAAGLFFARVIGKAAQNSVDSAKVQGVLNDMFGTPDIASATAPILKRRAAQSVLNSILFGCNMAAKLTGKIGESSVKGLLKNFGLDEDSLMGHLGNIDFDTWGCK